MNLELLGYASSLLDAAGRQLLFAAVLAVGVTLATWMLRRRSPWVHLALWGLVFLRLVLPPSLALPYSARDLLERGGLLRAAGDSGASTAGPGTIEPAVSDDASAGALSSRSPWRALILGLWGCGTLTFLGIWQRRRRFFRTLVARSRPVRDEGLLASLAAWRRRFGIRRTVRLVTSEESRTPFTLGVLRPVVFLPAAVLRHAERQVPEDVLAHELAHVRRFDDILLSTCRFLQCLYFFHPAVWIAGRKINEACEQLSDALVLGQGLDVRAYGRSILAVLEMNLRPAPATVALGTNGRSKVRIQTILSSNAAPASRKWPILGTVLLLGVFVLPMANAGTPEAAAPQDPAAAEETPAKTRPDASASPQQLSKGVMDKITQALPEQVSLQSLEIADDQVRIRGNAATTNAIATFIQNLDGVEEFTEVRPKNIKRQGNEGYSFNLDFHFTRPILEDGEDETGDAAL